MCKGNDGKYFPAGQLQECLRTEKFARQVLWRQEIDSTNNWAKEYAGSRIWMEKEPIRTAPFLWRKNRRREKAVKGEYGPLPREKISI